MRFELISTASEAIILSIELREQYLRKYRIFCGWVLKSLRYRFIRRIKAGAFTGAVNGHVHNV